MSVDATTAPRLTLLLPEGWVRLGVAAGSPADVARVVARSLVGVERARRDIARATLTRRLDAAVAEASARGVYELWLPIAPTNGISMPASVAVAALPTQPDPARPITEVLLGFSAASAGAIAVEIGGALGVRVIVDQPARLADSGELEAPATRLVNYIVSPAAGRGEWLVFTASIMIPDGENSAELLHALEFAIDSLMATVEFQEGP